MRDMFYNYEHNINKKEYPHPICWSNAPKKELESFGNTMLIVDLKGNELGLECKQGADIDLYFTLTGCAQNDSAANFILNCTAVILEILDNKHVVVQEHSYIPVDIYDGASNSLKITLTGASTWNLKRQSYKLRLTAIYPDGKYEIFSEHDGIFAVR